MSKLRIAHLSDNHFCEDLRLDDCVRVHTAFVEQALARGVDVVLLAGDFFERRSTPAERNALADWLALLVAHRMRVFGVAGNHDAPGDLEIFNHVLGDRGMIIDRELGATRASVLYRGDPLGEDCGPTLTVIGLPWVERSEYVKRDTTPSAVLAEAAALALEERAAGMLPVLVAHVEIEGYASSPGHSPAGSTLAVSADDPGFEPFAYVALGHIHRQQEWHAGRVAYCGSPQRNNFGEIEEKGWLFVELDLENETRTKHEFVPLPARTRKLLIAGPGDMATVLTEIERQASVADGDLVRLRIPCTPDTVGQYDREAIEQRLREFGAVEAKVELVVEQQDRVRSEEIAAATTTWEQVLAYFRAKGNMPDDATLDRLQTRLGEIEQEVIDNA